MKALGVGTFGKVWMVKHREKTYALKQIGKAQIVDKGLVQHVKREKDIMAECQNPFLVNLLGSFQDPEARIRRTLAQTAVAAAACGCC